MIYTDINFHYFYISFTKSNLMKKNIGSVDRVFRILIGIIIAGIGVFYESWWGLLGIIPFATALIGTCPAYLPFGINTRAKK